MVEFVFEKKPVLYKDSLDKMIERVDLISKGEADELIWFLEHDDIITRGLSAKDEELLNNDLPVVNTNRGGKFTYHGKGQRIIYCMMNLKKRNLTNVEFVDKLEDWIILSLLKIGIKAEKSELGHGVFVKDKKISSLGLRVKKGISYHGISLNVYPDLEKFKGIIPCGIKNAKVTSIRNEGFDISFDYVDNILKKCFNFDE